MKVKAISKTKDSLTLEVRDASSALVNGIRRASLNRVPVMAIEDVDIIKNTSAMYDELFAHRLGLVALSFTPKLYNMPDKCTCKGKGCIKCSAKLVLEKRGPCKIYASDLKPTSSDVKPIHPETVLLSLGANQEISIEATAFMSTGADHAKHIPAVIGYSFGTKNVKGREVADDSKITLKVDSIAGLSPKDVLLTAAGVLRKDLADLKKEVSSKVK